jgi:hypothetical protein
MLGGFIGAIEGDMIGQIGGKSIELSHNGCIRPSTHWQMHSARALGANARPITK